jgi:hypothetical protein
MIRLTSGMFHEPRLRRIGNWHPRWLHCSNHGRLETGRESIRLDDFDPLDFG